jgi:NADH dehydrogenase [ubiquinone] 1 alpha subcomplex assembly factor 7
MTLKKELIARIKANGPISIADFMTEALLHPTKGYYTSRNPFGSQGDFVTAPEISQMFGEIIGLSLAQSWLDQGAPSSFVLAELGPGQIYYAQLTQLKDLIKPQDFS